MNEENQVITVPAIFDEKPIGNKAKFQIPEYADNQNPIIAEVSNPEPIPLVKRLASKVMKTKKEALEQLLAQTQQNTNAFEPYMSQTIQFITCSYPQSQQRALKLLLIFLSGGGKLSIDQKTIIKVIIEKCMIVNREEIKSLCENILFWYMDNNYEDILLEQLKGELLSKNPKIIGISLLYIAKLLNNYGLKRMKGLQRFAKHLELMSAEAKPLAKAQIIQLYKQLYRWMGENIFKEFKLHHEVKDQLVKFTKDFKQEPLQIKRGQKPQQVGQGKKLMEIQNNQSNSNIEPLDVLSLYTSAWVDQTLSIPKWKDKKAILDDFIKKTKVPSIVPKQSENSAYIKLIKTLVLDNNIFLMQCGFFITQNLARGLKKYFSFVAKNIKGYIFDRLKNGKPNIVEAAQKTLKDLLFALTLEDMITDIKAGLQDKAPNMRREILKFLGMFTHRKQPKIMSIMKELLQKSAKMMEDGSAQVRLEALEFICNLKKTHDLKFFGDKLKNIDPKKLQIIRNTQALQTEVHEDMEIQKNQIQTASTLPPISTIQVPMIDEMNNNLKEINQGKQNIKVNKNKIDETSGKASNPPFSGIDSWLNQLSSPHETVRLNAYQQIAGKCQTSKDAIYKIKSRAIKESTQNILRVIIQIIKKYSNTELIELESLEFLCMHDWKKSKALFVEFIQTNKFSFAAEDFMKNNSALFSNIIKNNASTTPSNSNPTLTIKSLMLQLQNLIHKISNPQKEIKMEAAEKAIKIMEMLPKINSESDLIPSAGWNQELINQFYNITKFRLSEPEHQISVKYCKLIQLMIQKGIATKNKGIKLIIPTVFGKLKDGQPQIKSLLSNLAQSCPSFIFSLTLGQLCSENNRLGILEFIIEKNDLFLKNAELKHYLGPLLYIISNVNLDSKLKGNCQRLLDQLVQLCGESLLQTEAKKLKILNADQYLAKFNISIQSSLNSIQSIPKNINSKTDRLKLDQQNPWPITVTPSLILQLINIMLSMKEPLPLLITPLTLRAEQLSLIHSFESVFLIDNSDLLLKWVYWRTVIDPKEQVKQVLKLSSKIVISVYYALTEGEVIILLSSLINVLKRFHGECLPYVQDICKKLFMISYLLKQKSFRFWVNSLFDETIENTPVDEILQIFITCYSDLIAQQLVTLARIPSVMKNQEFIQFISSKFDAEILNVSGFKNISTRKTGKASVQPQLKQLLSDLGGPQNIISISTDQRMFYVTLFQKLTSVEMTNKLNEILSEKDQGSIVQTHLKIIYSVVVPFMKREISIINIFTYFKEFSRFVEQTLGLLAVMTGAPKVKYSQYLKDLTRVLVYFLIDLDQNTIENKNEITRVVNKIILQLLQHSQTRHMLQILFLLLKNQINVNISTKILHLLIKCITKVCKDKKFKTRAQEDITFIVNETNNILKQNSINLDHPIIKSLKNFYGQLANLYPVFHIIVKKLYEEGQACSTIIQIFKESKIIPNQNDDLCAYEIKEKSKEQVNPIRQMGTIGITKLMAIKKNDNRDL